MSNLPPMSGRIFRDYFMIEGDGPQDATPPPDHDPYERCDFDEDGGDDE